MDQSLAKILSVHKAALRKSTRRPIPAPKSLEECVQAFGRFLTVAFA